VTVKLSAKLPMAASTARIRATRYMKESCLKDTRSVLGKLSTVVEGKSVSGRVEHSVGVFKVSSKAC
jgi:hypothetical protein